MHAQTFWIWEPLDPLFSTQKLWSPHDNSKFTYAIRYTPTAIEALLTPTGIRSFVGNKMFWCWMIFFRHMTNCSLMPITIQSAPATEVWSTTIHARNANFEFIYHTHSERDNRISRDRIILHNSAWFCVKARCMRCVLFNYSSFSLQ